MMLRIYNPTNVKVEKDFSGVGVRRYAHGECTLIDIEFLYSMMKKYWGQITVKVSKFFTKINFNRKRSYIHCSCMLCGF